MKSRRGKSTPALPSGLTFETSNGTIWGTPTELWTQTAYTVWANNTGGSAVAYLNITVVDQVPSSVSYSPADLTLTNNTASSDLPLSPTITGSGEITSWEINASFTERSDLRDQQRNHLGNTDRTVDANGLHGLGQQHRWVRRRLPQHHRG